MTRRWQLAIAVALIVVVSLALDAGWRWWHNRAPFGPDVLATTASLELTTYEDAQHLLGEDVNAPYPNPGHQLILARVTWRTPPQEHAPAEFQVATAPVAVSDLLLAMVYVGRDDQIFWAQRLIG